MAHLKTLARPQPRPQERLQVRADPGALLRSLRDVAANAARRAEDLDHGGAFPAADVSDLAAAGALTAPLPVASGGLGLGTSPQGAMPLMAALRCIGAGSLPLGRLYEGHVNAIRLLVRYGTLAQLAAAAGDAARGLLFGVWNTEGAEGLRLVRSAAGLRLEGAKTFASGAGFVARPLVTAQTAEGERLMVLAPLDLARHRARADLSCWKAHGMRASATGSFDFSGLPLEPGDVIGGPGDYLKQPDFSIGAWRFAAVQLGGIERLLDEARRHLRAVGRTEDPHQRLRMGQAAMAAETAHLWVRRAAQMAEADTVERDPDAVVAYVGLARSAVERAGLDMLELVHRCVGLAGFLEPHPIERLSRDLATYLRQPAPDRALTEAAGHILSTDTPFEDTWTGKIEAGDWDA